MYGLKFSDSELLAALKSGRDPALDHKGRMDRVLRFHRQHVAMEASRLIEDVPATGPYLLNRFAYPATMMLAFQALLGQGPKAPGPNGLCLEHLSPSESRSLCRGLAEAVRDGVYRPGPDRVVLIPKDTAGNFRKLTIQNNEDRIVAKALALILEPILEREFWPFSFGFRPGRGAQSALATALAFAKREDRWFWLCGDAARAFDRIQHTRFLDACRKRFPPEMVQVISTIAYTGHPRGLRQGSPASPLSMNLFYDHFLDWRWNAKFPAVPLFRYADDLLILCETRNEAVVSYAELESRMVSIGTPLKSSARDSLHDLSSGEAVDWLGYRIGLSRGEPSIRIADRAWKRLRMHFEEAHCKPAPPLRAVEIIRGWLGYLGPCYSHEDKGTILDRVREMAAVQAFDELPSVQELESWWSAAHARWQRLRVREENLLPDRVRIIRQHQDGLSKQIPRFSR
jgi:hypothetical protein